MPPKAKVTKEDIIHAAADVIREDGAAALNARAVASRLGTSTQPIFSHYNTMEALKTDTVSYADELYQSFLQRDMTSGEYPVYKASGIAYIRFAREEKELFKLLFMRDRSKEKIPQNLDEIRPMVQIIQKNTGLSEQDAAMFHLEMWVYVHGIATMIATSYLEWNGDMISKMLTDGYVGLKERYCGREMDHGSD